MKTFKTIAEYLSIILLVIIIRVFIITPVQVDGLSMYDTLNDNDIMMLNIIGYRMDGIKRFDIIVFDHNGERLIKRVIGLPGESIKYQNHELYVNDVLVREPYLKEKTEDFTLLDSTGFDKVPDNKYFVLGDNRINSTDSRYIGFIDKKDILGKTNLVLFPFNHFGIVK